MFCITPYNICRWIDRLRSVEEIVLLLKLLQLCIPQVELEKRSFSFGAPDSEYIVSSSTEVGTAIQAALR